jgi:hypothetical protein
MPKRTNPFQQFVYLIQHQMKDRADTVVTESKILIDRQTGQQRETDIAVECSPNGVPYVLAFECNKHSRKTTIEWVERMLKKHEHLSDKLVLVTQKGFTRTGLDLARRHRAETVTLTAAKHTDWPAQIDGFTELLFANFDFILKLYTVEYDLPAGAPHFTNGQTVQMTDSAGKSASLPTALDELLRDYELFGKHAMQLLYELPPEKRKSEHIVKVEYTPPQGLAVVLAQGAISYRLRKIAFSVGAKMGETPLKLDHGTYNDMRVAFAAAKVDSGGLAGHDVQFVLTEQQGQPPKAAIMLSGTNSTEKPFVQTLEVAPPDKQARTAKRPLDPAK